MTTQFPVIVSPTIERRGFMTHDVILSQSDIIPTVEKTRVFTIPTVDLEGCEEKLDFACLLGHGSVPFNINERCFDPFSPDKTSAISIRFDGQASYTHLAAAVRRSEVKFYDSVPFNGNGGVDPCIIERQQVFDAWVITFFANRIGIFPQPAVPALTSEATYNDPDNAPDYLAYISLYPNLLQRVVQAVPTPNCGLLYIMTAEVFQE